MRSFRAGLSGQFDARVPRDGRGRRALSQFEVAVAFRDDSGGRLDDGTRPHRAHRSVAGDVHLATDGDHHDRLGGGSGRSEHRTRAHAKHERRGQHHREASRYRSHAARSWP
jgi:hypothetical protein